MEFSDSHRGPVLTPWQLLCFSREGPLPDGRNVHLPVSFECELTCLHLPAVGFFYEVVLCIFHRKNFCLPVEEPTLAVSVGAVWLTTRLGFKAPPTEPDHCKLLDLHSGGEGLRCHRETGRSRFGSPSKS